MIPADGQWVIDTLRRRRGAYLLAEAYYHGAHRLAFATERFWSVFGGLFREFADNLCPTVVDSLVDRLQVRGFSDNGPQANADTSTEAAEAVWTLNEMAVQSGAVMQDAALYGDAYVIVWPDDEMVPAIYPQTPTECAVRYSRSRPGRVELGGKLWRADDGRGRLTLYYPDRLEHFVTRGKVTGGLPDKASRFTEYAEEGPPTVPNGWGVVPVYHFANGAGVGRAGRSELAPVIPLQDALNKALIDMLVAMEFVAFPQRWATGVETPIDPDTGQELPPFKFGTERLLTHPDKDVTFGQFPQADLAQHVQVQDSLRLEVARVSGVPVWLLLPGGTPPSGEALKMGESRIVKKAHDRMRAWGPRWAAVTALAMRMAQVSTSGELETMWVAPETRQEREEAEVALLKGQSGVSEAQRQRELGYSAEEIDRMAAERAGEREAQASALAAGGLGT